jgi:hypothetical protein
MKDWMGPTAILDDVKKTKFFALPELELRPLGRPVHNQALYRLRYPGSYYSTHGFCKCDTTLNSKQVANQLRQLVLHLLQEERLYLRQ